MQVKTYSAIVEVAMKLPFGKPEQAHVDVDMLSAYLDNQVTPAERGQRRRTPGYLCRVPGRARWSAPDRGAAPGVAARAGAAGIYALRSAGRHPPAEPRPAWGSVLRGLGAVTAIALVAVVAVSLLNRPSWQPAATIARNAPPAATAQPAVQPVAPAESAPVEPVAKAPAPAPAEPAPIAEKAVEKSATVADAAAPTVAAEPAPAAPAAEPAAEEPEAIPPAAAAAKVAATEAPSLMAMAAPAPQETPAAGVMAFGRGGGGRGGNAG